ncbi:MAG: PAS domain S-box protein [Candidatus Nomurabacteria bacterium]|nr:MAG: PAS domain S-box protein [Candidatus Nomurabacteria bacterium]
MKLADIFELILIVLIPLVLPIVWWFILPGESSGAVFMTVFVVQIILTFSLYLLTRRNIRVTSAEIAVYKSDANEQFNSIYERSPIPYVTINQTGEIIMFNPAAVNFFESSTDSIVGLNFFDLLLDEQPDNLSVVKGKVDSGVTVNDEELQIHTTAGNIKWASLSVYPYEVKDQRLVSIQDITEQKIVDAAKSEFVALATHQLRTPISAIRFNVELLQNKMKGTLTEDQTKYINKIDRNIVRMIALINDFLSVSKLEMGTFATSLQPIDMTQFLDSIVDEYIEKITDKNIKMSRHDIPASLSYNSDLRLLHIIVSNLMSNSVKYTRASGEITLSYELHDNKTIVIVVTDNGIGIPSNEIDNLFSKFYRASNAQAQNTEGTGLGLYIVKLSVEKLGGKIEVASDTEVGTTFTVTLPY